MSEPRIVKVNHALAERLGFNPDELDSLAGAELLSGNAPPVGSVPIALAYAGHQFGSFVPQLGDGRAILLGEVINRDGRRLDIQLKGAGRTPFSRNGDGRAALGPVLREYIVSEAMAALGIPTTRSLAVVTTGEPVVRDRVLPGAVLARVAASHIRIGTFQYFAARRDYEAVTRLIEYALDRHYPGARGDRSPALSLLEHVVEAQAHLIARWMGVGFIHGVMNTDNMTISGETIDYGPCAFLDEYEPNKTFSSIDRMGRYSFANQPAIAQWNLARFAEALLPCLADTEQAAVGLAAECLQQFRITFETEHARVLRMKLGLVREDEGDLVLASELMACLASNGVDHTVFFRQLCAAAADASTDPQLLAPFDDPGPLSKWLKTWRQRLGRESISPDARLSLMRRANPAFIPRNHRIEQAIHAAIQEADFAPFETLVRVLERPYEDQPELAYLAEPPSPEERVLQTFCGT